MVGTNRNGWLAQIWAWGPALALMVVIFLLSSVEKADLPQFGWLDFAVKKANHFLGYALLALAYQRGMGAGRRIWLPAWVLTGFFAISDELHQSFVAGRGSTWVDVVIDQSGAALALFWWTRWATLRRLARLFMAPTGDD